MQRRRVCGEVRERQPQAGECPEPPRAGKTHGGFFPRDLGEHGPANTWILDFWLPGLCEEKKKSLLCESSQFVHQVVAFCYRGCQKLIHTVPSLFEMVGRQSEEYFCLRARPYWLLLFLIFPPVCAQGSALPPAWGFVEPLGAPFGFLLTQNHSNLHQAADLPSQEGENYFQ